MAMKHLKIDGCLPRCWIYCKSYSQSRCGSEGLITCYNPEVVEVRMGLCVPASPLHSPLTRLLDKFMFVGKKTFLHELSEFAFPILFPLLLYQRADNNSQAVGIDTRVRAG